jgi:DUF971 family protein
MSRFFVKNIAQKDPYTFSILWTDGKVQDFRLSTVQKNCTCARCREEKTGAFISKVDEEVQATLIKNVGRYALRIDFTSGCSSGIYTFSLLRNLC